MFIFALFDLFFEGETLEDSVGKLRRKYERFLKGKEDVLEVRDEARLILEEAKKKGDSKVMDEVGDMLLDLDFSIEENKCKCHRE